MFEEQHVLPCVTLCPEFHAARRHVSQCGQNRRLGRNQVVLPVLPYVSVRFPPMLRLRSGEMPCVHRRSPQQRAPLMPCSQSQHSHPGPGTWDAGVRSSDRDPLLGVWTCCWDRAGRDHSIVSCGGFGSKLSRGSETCRVQDFGVLTTELVKPEGKCCSVPGNRVPALPRGERRAQQP